MTQDYWDKTHSEKYSKADWSKQPSIFAKFAVKYFPKTGKLLEIGTGQGGDAGFFHSLGYEITATDFSDEALKNAKDNFKDINFIRLDTAQRLPFQNQSFDVVYSHMALHYFDEQTTKRVFQDIQRVLKTGGIFATIVNTMDDAEKEIEKYIELEPEFYQDPKGVAKRYFTVESMREFTENLFETVLLDNKGETYKDDIKTLVRYVGRKLE